jgi:hypothetical protein
MLLLAGCAHPAAPAAPAAPPPPEDHWETVGDRQLVSPAPCGAGPYELELPARRDEWGRRVVLRVYSARGLVLDSHVEGVDDRGRSTWQTGFPRGQIADGDHSHCRADAGDATTVVATGKPGHAAPAPTTAGGRTSYDTPADELPRLVERTGPIAAPLLEQGALGWLPHGDPWFYADDAQTDFMNRLDGMTRIRIRLWLEGESDLDGVVFEVLDQRLVPDEPLATYEPHFRARVAEADARREAARPAPDACPGCRQQQLNARVERCRHEAHDADECRFLHARNGREPPAPRAEPVPRTPGRDVTWIPGYWSWSEDLDDFVWIAGVYVVHAPDQLTVSTEAVPDRTSDQAQAIAAMPAPADLAPPEPSREVAVAPPPAPRVEVIVAPPAVLGAAWIPGHWRLVATSWQWVAGVWVRPPAGMRFQPPALQVRGAVHVYVPARWVHGR